MFAINEQILRSAIEQARKKHGANLNYDLVFSLVSKVNQKKEEMKFWEAMRYSLNEMYLWDKGSNKTRTYYKSAVATYFSKISALARSARATRGIKKTPETRPKVTGTILLERSGQYALKI